MMNPGPPDDSLPVAVARVIRERDDALRRLHALEVRLPDIARRMYRRGYFAGRRAAQRGAPVVTNPERKARGWAREVLGMTGGAHDGSPTA